MHKVRSLLVLALASTLIALGLVAASPGVAFGNPAPTTPTITQSFLTNTNQTFTEYSRR